MRVRSIGLYLILLLSIASGQAAGPYRLIKTDSIRAVVDSLRIVSSTRFYQGVLFDNKPKWRSETALFSGDSTIFRTFSDSLYVRKAYSNIFSAPNYFTARQYYTSQETDTIKDRTNNGGVIINDTAVVTGTLSIGGNGSTSGFRMTSFFLDKWDSTSGWNFTAGYPTFYNRVRSARIEAYGSDFSSSTTKSNFYTSSRNAYIRTGKWDTAPSTHLQEKYMLLDSVGNWTLGDYQATSTVFKIDTNGTVKTGAWQGTAIDTTYLNAIAHISGGYGITATRYNTKDFQITVDSATLRSKFVPYSGANASVNIGSQSFTTTGTGTFGPVVGTTGTWTGTQQVTLATGQTGLRLVTTGITGPAVVWRAGFLGASSTNGIIMRTDSTSKWSLNTIAGTELASQNASGFSVVGTGTFGASVRATGSGAAYDSAQAGLRVYRSGVASGNFLTQIFSGGNSTGLEKMFGGITVIVGTTTNGIETGRLWRAVLNKAGTTTTVFEADSLKRFSTGGGLVSATGQFQVQNGLLANATEWYNSRSTQIAAFDSVGKLQTGGLTSVGAFGVSNHTDTVTYTNLSSGMSKNLTSTAGMYRLVYTMFCTTADAAAGSVQLTLSFNNGGAQTMTSAAVNLTSTSNKDDDVFVFYVASGTPSVSTAITGSAGTSKHSVHAIVERLK